jgi:hypothetical protein
MAQVTVVFDDKVILKDGVALHFEGDGIANFDAVVTAQGDTGLHAIQWNGESGECEHKDGSAHTAVEASKVDAYVTAFDAEIERVRQAEKTNFLAIDADALARAERDSLIAQTDWWVLPDRTPTQAQLDYRQALRDLPASADWNPTMTWDDATWTGSLTGVNWPTQP